MDKSLPVCAACGLAWEPPAGEADYSTCSARRARLFGAYVDIDD